MMASMKMQEDVCMLETRMRITTVQQWFGDTEGRPTSARETYV